MSSGRRSSEESLEDSIKNRLDVAIDRMLDMGRRERYAELQNIDQTGKVEINSRKLEIEFQGEGRKRSHGGPACAQMSSTGGDYETEGAKSSLPVSTEITDLSKQRKVTRLLESFLFRNKLERSIRESSASGHRAMLSNGVVPLKIKRARVTESGDTSSPGSVVVDNTIGSDTDSSRGSTVEERSAILRCPSRAKRPAGSQRPSQIRRRATETVQPLKETGVTTAQQPVVNERPIVTTTLTVHEGGITQPPQSAVGPLQGLGVNMNIEQYEEWLHAQLAIVHGLGQAVPVTIPRVLDEHTGGITLLQQQPQPNIITTRDTGDNDDDNDGDEFEYSDTAESMDDDDDDEMNDVLIGSSLNDVEEDNLISDLVELAHWQIVSRALRSEVRDILERHLQDRIGAISSRGHQGNGSSTPMRERRRAVRPQSQQSEPPTTAENETHRQHEPREGSAQVEPSVPTNTTQAIVNQPVNERGTNRPRLGTDSARRIRVLEVKINELTELVKLSFDFQVDLKRALHQEVAAAFHAQGVTADRFPRSTNPAAEGQCIICLDRTIDSVLYQCGHMCCCLQCGHRLRGQGLHCPLCRAPINDIVRVYRAQTEQDMDNNE